MIKKFSTLALAAMIALPAAASAGGSGDLAEQIERLTQELNKLKEQMTEMKETQVETKEKVDLASRIQWGGDFRARMDSFSQNKRATGDYSNDTLLTNRLRLEMKAKALEDVTFKGRLAMYKAWGEQVNPNFVAGAGPYTQDGAATRQPEDSILRVDRAYVNWTNIAGQPVWFSIGRRPTSDGAPNHLKLNYDEKSATPNAFMDWPFDGLTFGYAYENLFGLKDFPGRVRLCYGRGFENGLKVDNNVSAGTATLDDTDFGGISWDIYQSGNRFLYMQSFAVWNAFNFPTDADGLLATHYAGYWPNGRENVGNLYHTSTVYMDKWQNLNYFGSFGWSVTDPDESSTYGMFGSQGDSKNGYAFHVGGRYDIDDYRLKLGLEYNHGTEYWVGMAPGHDDIYASKLNTRGDAWEVYSIYDIPGGEKIFAGNKAFIRLGYIHYNYDWTGSGDWNFAPVDVDSAAGLTNDAITEADQIYMTFEAFF